MVKNVDGQNKCGRLMKKHVFNKWLPNSRASILLTPLALACSYSPVAAASILSLCALRPVLSQGPQKLKSVLPIHSAFHAHLARSNFFSAQCCFHYAPDLSFSQTCAELGKNMDLNSKCVGHYRQNDTQNGNDVVCM